MTDNEHPVHDLFDYEFNGYLIVARELLKKMSLPEDRRVCDKYIRASMLMEKSEDLKVKLHRNRFFRFFLKAMRRTVDNQEKVMQHFVDIDGVKGDQVGQDYSQWSNDGKTYVAAKIIPGYGTLIYMACSDNADDWIRNGFAGLPDYNDSDASKIFDGLMEEAKMREDLAYMARFGCGLDDQSFDREIETQAAHQKRLEDHIKWQEEQERLNPGSQPSMSQPKYATPNPRYRPMGSPMSPSKKAAYRRARDMFREGRNSDDPLSPGSPGTPGTQTTSTPMTSTPGTPATPPTGAGRTPPGQPPASGGTTPP